MIRQSDEGTKQRAYPHAIVVGIERYPRKITRNMGPKKVAKRSRVKPFIKVGYAVLCLLSRCTDALGRRSTTTTSCRHAMRSNSTA